LRKPEACAVTRAREKVAGYFIWLHGMHTVDKEGHGPMGPCVRWSWTNCATKISLFSKKILLSFSTNNDTYALIFYDSRVMNSFNTTPWSFPMVFLSSILPLHIYSIPVFFSHSSVFVFFVSNRPIYETME
jgi:hypothetical protein